MVSEMIDIIKEIDNEIFLRTFNLITSKKMLYICNVDESHAVSGNKMTKAVKEKVISRNPCLTISAILEETAATFEDEKSYNEYLECYGLKEPGLNTVIRTCYDILGLQTFYTLGEKEARAWSMVSGGTAVDAASTIHSDFRKLFVRAETVSYNDFIKAQSEKNARDLGLIRKEGKDYIPQEGDIFNFLVSR